MTCRVYAEEGKEVAKQEDKEEDEDKEEGGEEEEAEGGDEEEEDEPEDVRWPWYLVRRCADVCISLCSSPAGLDRAHMRLSYCPRPPHDTARSFRPGPTASTRHPRGMRKLGGMPARQEALSALRRQDRGGQGVAWRWVGERSECSETGVGGRAKAAREMGAQGICGASEESRDERALASGQLVLSARILASDRPAQGLRLSLPVAILLEQR